MTTVYLKKNEEKRILGGHPWVYANEVAKIEEKDKNGSLVTVRSFNGQYIGKGFINHLSKILVRILIRDNEELTPDFFEKRIASANATRVSLGLFDCYRAVFSESDDLPGLIVDKYHDLLCIQILTLGMEQHREEIMQALLKIFAPRGIYERSDTPSREKEGLPLKKGIVYGAFVPSLFVEENGLQMKVDLENGQKTGYFLDQKDNRFALRRYVKGKTVLDCFCNSGGFSLNAAYAGAEKVYAWDISKKALSDVEENAEKNGLSAKIETKECDVFQALRDAKKEGKQFGCIVLDPPAFCKSVSEVQDAYKGYKDINISALKILEKGGYLISSSCTHFMTLPLFMKMLSEASCEAHKRLRLLEVKTQCLDHPSFITEDEALYLKFFVLQSMD